MKKISCFIATLVGAFTIGLIGCAPKLPTTNYEKVKFAFNGVEKSFKNKKAAKKSAIVMPKSKIGGSNPNSALETIFSLYNEDDKRDDFLDDISYNEPPMIQFQYIKKVLEKIGDGYEFNKKYYNTITGDMYLDINTGLKAETKDEYKYNYTFVLAMNINIDDNNLITSDVSFDINLKKGSESYTTKWYVGIELDYDMANSSPNYTMSMVTENDERELPYYGHYTYEYDYVEVKNSTINEWRKFCMDNDHRLYKDDAHQDFSDYVNEGCEYRVDACAWFKNGTYYKSKKTRQEGQYADTVANALFKDLGLNANEIDADRFFNQTGEINDKIIVCYNDFSKIAKEDIIYDLVCRDEDHHEENKVATSIRAFNSDLTGGAGNYQVPGNTLIRELLSSFTDNFGERVVIHLYYLDQHEGRLSEITELSYLRLFLKAHNSNESIQVNLEDSLYDAVVRGNIQERGLSIAFIDDNNIGGYMDFSYADEFPSPSYVKPEFPKVLKDIGVPEYEGERYSFGAGCVFDKEPYKLVIIDTDGNEEENYRTKLLKNGFEVTEIMGYREYKKLVNGKYVCISINNAAIESGCLTITVSTQDAPDAFVVNAVSMVGSFNNWQVDTNCAEFTKTGENEFTLDVHMVVGEKFKIVVNHEWGQRGGYGYHDIDGIDMLFKALQPEGEEDNVLVTASCHIVLRALIDGEFIHLVLTEGELEIR